MRLISWTLRSGSEQVPYNYIFTLWFFGTTDCIKNTAWKRQVIFFTQRIPRYKIQIDASLSLRHSFRI
jgi:hypothetical protein